MLSMRLSSDKLLNYRPNLFGLDSHQVKGVYRTNHEQDCSMIAGVPAILCRLRQAVAKIEGQGTDLGIGVRALVFGVRNIDAVLQGGLAPASLHEIAPAGMCDFGAAVGFAFSLAARASDGRNTLWIQTDFA